MSLSCRLNTIIEPPAIAVDISTESSIVLLGLLLLFSAKVLDLSGWRYLLSKVINLVWICATPNQILIDRLSLNFPIAFPVVVRCILNLI
jgi:hypothetical protein